MPAAATVGCGCSTGSPSWPSVAALPVVLDLSDDSSGEDEEDAGAAAAAADDEEEESPAVVDDEKEEDEDDGEAGVVEEDGTGEPTGPSELPGGDIGREAESETPTGKVKSSD